MKHCSACGYPNPDAQQQCHNCQAALPEPSTVATRKRTLGALFAAACLFGLLVYAFRNEKMNMVGETALLYKAIPGLSVSTVVEKLETDWGMKFDQPHEVTSADGNGSWSVLDGKCTDSATGADLVCQVGYFAEDEVWSVGYYVEFDGADGGEGAVERESLNRLSVRYLDDCAAIPFDGSDSAATCSVLAEILPQADGKQEVTQGKVIVNIWSNDNVCSKALEIEHLSTRQATGD